MVKSLINGLLSLANLKLVRMTRPANAGTEPSLPPFVPSGDRERSVDFMEIAGSGVFAFEDHLHFRMPDHIKRQSVDEFAGRKRTWERIHLDPTLARVVKYFVQNKMPLTVLDIGGHWGLFSFDIAKILRHLGAPGTIVCFEPGPTAELIRASVEINGFEDLITVRNKAVSDRTGPTLFYIREQFTESNGLVRQGHHDRAQLAHALDVRQVLREYASASGFFIKVDTEGMEETIVRAAESDEKRGQTVYMLEVAYGPPQKQVVGFLEYLSRRFVIYDIPTQAQLAPAQFPGFVDGLIDRPARFTDVLCIPIGHPLNEGYWKVRA